MDNTTTWLPIETAPRDGTLIAALWMPKQKVVEPHCYGMTVFEGGRWVNPEDEDDFYVEPTHWVPLPPPPAA